MTTVRDDVDLAGARPCPTLVGSCHGFQIRTSAPLQLVREPLDLAAWGSLEIQVAPEVEPEPTHAPVLATWMPTAQRPLSARLYDLGHAYGMWIDGFGLYRTDAQRRTVTLPAGLPTPRAESKLWGIPTVLCFTYLGDLSLHCAAVEVGGRAIVMIAPGRFGKTTLAAAFHRAGFRVLSEDMCRCTVDPTPSIFPAAAMLRVRHPTLRALGPPPDAHVVLEHGDRVEFALAKERRGGGVPVPVAALVTLQIGDAGEPRFEPVPLDVAIRDIWATSAKLPIDADRERCFRGVTALAEAVPVWRLTRTLDFAMLPALVDEIVATCTP